MREKGYRGSIHYLQEIGFLSPRVQAAHMVWLDDEEIEIAASSGMGMSWTPTIMMACQSYARIDKLMKSGIRWASERTASPWTWSRSCATPSTAPTT